MYPSIPSWEELAAVVAVARAGSISAAARENGLQQQTVSARIQRAETTLGFQLFNRSPYGVRLTERGDEAIDTITALLDEGTLFSRRMRTLADDATPRHLTVAVSNTIAEVYFPSWAATFHDCYPSVQVTMLQANSSGVRDLVSQGQASVGCVEGGHNPHHLAAVDLGHDDLVVVVPAGHAWDGESISKEELQTTPLVVREPGSGSRDVVEEALGNIAAPAGEFGSMASQRAGILALQAPGVIAERAVADYVAMRRLVIVNTPGVRFTRALQAVRLRHSSFSQEAEALVDTARKALAAPPPGT